MYGTSRHRLKGSTPKIGLRNLRALMHAYRGRRFKRALGGGVRQPRDLGMRVRRRVLNE